MNRKSIIFLLVRHLYVFCTFFVCYGHSLAHILDVICMFFVRLLYVMDILWDIFYTSFVCYGHSLGHILDVICMYVFRPHALPFLNDEESGSG